MAIEKVGRVGGLAEAIVACDRDCGVPRRTTALETDAAGAGRRRGATKATRICLDVNMVAGEETTRRWDRFNFVWGYIHSLVLKTQSSFRAFLVKFIP